MTHPALLTAPTTLDANPLSGECVKRHVSQRPPFGFLFPSSSSSCMTTITLDPTDDAHDPDAHRALEERVRQWTGTPIRAIVPLPRRKCVLPNDSTSLGGGQQQQQPPQQHHQHQHQHHHAGAAAPNRNTTAVSTPACLSRATHVRPDDMDSEAEIEAEDGDADGEEDEDEEDGGPSSGSRYCSYESITAAEGLAAWSFEELRVECYAQSLIARGTKPPPVVQPALTIPPAFVPRIVPRS